MNIIWKKINLPSYVKGWKKFESDNKSIVVNVWFVKNDKEEIKQAYIAKQMLTVESK